MCPEFGWFHICAVGIIIKSLSSPCRIESGRHNFRVNIVDKYLELSAPLPPLPVPPNPNSSNLV